MDDSLNTSVESIIESLNDSPMIKFNKKTTKINDVLNANPTKINVDSFQYMNKFDVCKVLVHLLQNPKANTLPSTDNLVVDNGNISNDDTEVSTTCKETVNIEDIHGKVYNNLKYMIATSMSEMKSEILDKVQLAIDSKLSNSDGNNNIVENVQIVDKPRLYADVAMTKDVPTINKQPSIMSMSSDKLSPKSSQSSEHVLVLTTGKGSIDFPSVKYAITDASLSTLLLCF